MFSENCVNMYYHTYIAYYTGSFVIYVHILGKSIGEGGGLILNRDSILEGK